MKSRTGHERLEPRGGLDEFDAFLLQFVGDGAEESVRISFLQPEQKRHGPKVRPEIEEISGRDLSQHDAVPDPMAGQRGNHF